MKLDVRSVSKTYGPVVALRDVSFSVRAGECLCLLGRNGAGKTTLINVLSDLARANQGTVVYDDLDLERDGTAVKRRIGVLPDRDPTISELTGWQYLELVCLLRDIPAPRENPSVAALARTLLESDEVLERLIGGYSRGMRAKLGICAALVHDPLVVLLDEPFSSLDPVSAAVVLDVLRQRRDSGTALLISSHALAHVERLATHIGVLDAGRLLFAGSLSSFRTNATSVEVSLLRMLGVGPAPVTDPGLTPAMRSR